MAYKDKEKQREYEKRRWLRTKDDPSKLAKQRDCQRKARQGIKNLVLAWKERGCLYCGEKEPVVLQAHHRDPSLKESSINRLIADRAGKMVVQAELDKCDCLCANCHLKLHAGLITVG